MSNTQEAVELSQEQRLIAEEIKAQIMREMEKEADAIALRMATCPDQELLGKGEVSLRDAMMRVGAKVLQVGMEQRKKGAT